ISAVVTGRAGLVRRTDERTTAPDGAVTTTPRFTLHLAPATKPSGLDWLGDIPEHWEVILLKRIAQISYGVGGEIDRSLDTGLKTISLPNIDIEGNLKLDDVPFAEVSEFEKHQVLL